MVNVELTIKNMITGNVCRTEIVKFNRLWTARCWAINAMKFNDVDSAKIVDPITNKVLLHLPL